MFREHLQKIIDSCDGAAAAIVMGFDGIAVDVAVGEAGEADAEVQTIGMEFSFVLGQVRKAAELLDVGTLQEVVIRAENLTFIIHVLNEDYFLGLALKPRGNFGKGRFLVRMALTDLLADLRGRQLQR